VRVLVTGAEGMLGRAVVPLLAQHLDVVGVDLPDGDLTDPTAVTDLWRRHGPDWCVHAAAYTDVDGAETEQELARAVNGTATGLVASACATAGVGLTYLSTDYVFDGTGAGYDEDAPRAPVNHYGWTKAEGEETVQASSGPWQIVRTSWLFGPGPRNFVLTIRRLLGERSTLRVVDDQIGSPTYAPDLASVLLFLVRDGSRGIYHATNAGVCTWFEFAREIARQEGEDPERIKPCPSSAYPTPARRPACSILRSGQLEAIGCPARPPWQEALARYLRSLEEDQPDG